MAPVEIVPLEKPEHYFTDPVEINMAERVANGELFEAIEDLSPGYRETLDRTLEIAAQGEVTVLTWAYLCLDTCPDIGSKISLAAAMLDEVGHAHQQGMLWERLGRNMHEEAFHRPPTKYWSFPILEFKPKNYIEFLACQSMLDRAGRYTTWDIERHCSFAPYRRCLKKVNYEEVFHFRHGAYWIEYYWNASPETREAVQEAMDWVFPHGVFWYGRPDALKGHNDQLIYGIRKWTNDTMRDKWLQSASKFAKKVGFKVPTVYDEEKGKYVLDMPYPMTFDRDKRDWTWEECTWEESINNLKRGGPERPGIYERLQTEEWGDSLWAS